MSTEKQPPTQTSTQNNDKLPPAKALPGATPEQGLSAMTLQRVHQAPGPLRPGEVLQLQRMIGNQAVTRLLTGSGTPAIQRKIKVKDASQLGQNEHPNDSEGLKKIRAHPLPFLFNFEDFYHINNHRPSGRFILPPAKHVIGERHDQSQFQQAVKDWGWGAKRMVESLSSHPNMEQYPGEAAAAKDPNRVEYEAKPLENTVAKNLAILNLIQNKITTLKLLQGFHRKGELDSETKTTVTQKLAPELEGEMDELESMKNSLVAYGGGGSSWFSCASAPEERSGSAEIQTLKSMKGKSDLLKRVGESLVMAQKLRHVELAFQEVDALQPLVDALVDANLGIAKGDDPATYKKLDMDARRKEFRNINLGVTPTIPLRDHYMAQNIGKLEIPGLVQVGSKHLPGVTKRLGELGILNQAKLYNSYDDFVEATEADKVLDEVDDY